MWSNAHTEFLFLDAWYKQQARFRKVFLKQRAHMEILFGYNTASSVPKSFWPSRRKELPKSWIRYPCGSQIYLPTEMKTQSGFKLVALSRRMTPRTLLKKLKQDLWKSCQVTDPCADKNLTKTRTGHRPVRTKFWKFPVNTWARCADKNGLNFDSLNLSGQKLVEHWSIATCYNFN